MNTHKNHHFVPVFLLKQWYVSDSKKLFVYKRLYDGSLRCDLLGPDSIAYERHLYSTERSSDLPDVSIEKEFLSKIVDSPAALVHKDMLEKGLNSLTDNQRKAWAIFLLASLFRLPALVENFREIGRRKLLEQFKSIANIVGDPAADEIFQNPKYRDMLDDKGMETFVSAIISKKHTEWICECNWSIIKIPTSIGTAVIGDLPVGIFGELMENDFGIVAPISPSHYFICTTKGKYTEKFKNKQDEKDLMKSTNKWLVLHAIDYVYTKDQTHERLIKKHLGKARKIIESRKPN